MAPLGSSTGEAGMGTFQGDDPAKGRKPLNDAFSVVVGVVAGAVVTGATEFAGGAAVVGAFVWRGPVAVVVGAFVGRGPAAVVGRVVVAVAGGRVVLVVAGLEAGAPVVDVDRGAGACVVVVGRGNGT